MADLADLAVRPLYLLARALLWLAWDFLLLEVAWSVGWPICRVLSVGQLPSVGFREVDEANLLETVLVCAVGLAALVGAVWWLASRLG